MSTESWSVRALGDVSHVEMGQSPPSEFVSDQPGNGIAFLQGNAEFTSEFPRPRLWCTRPAKLAKPGDILISVRAPVGAINRADRQYGIGRGLAAVRFTGIDPDYGYHALLRFSAGLHRVSQGTTFDAIGGTELRRLTLPHYPRPEQRRIAEIFDAADEAIRSTEKIIAKLDRMKQGLLHDLMTRGLDHNGEERDPQRHPEQFKASPLGRIPKRWAVSLVVNEFDLQLGKMLSGKARQGRNPKPYINNEALRWDHVDTSHLPLMDFTSAEQEKFSLRVGDLLICEGGEVGRAALWRGELDDCYFQKAIHRLRPTRGYDPRFMLRYLKLASTTRRLVPLTSQTSIAHLTKEKLALLPIPVPPEEEQLGISERLDAIDYRINDEGSQLRKLRLLSSGLKDDLLFGRVPVTIVKGDAA